MQPTTYTSRSSGRFNKLPDVSLDSLEARLSELAAHYSSALEKQDSIQAESISESLSEQLSLLSSFIHRNAQTPLERDRMRKRLDPLLNRIEGLIRQSTAVKDQYAAELAGMENARWNGERLADVYQGAE